MKTGSIISSNLYKRKESGVEGMDIAGTGVKTECASIVHCLACSSNQNSNENYSATGAVRNKSKRNKQTLNVKIMKGLPLWSFIFLTWLNLSVGRTEGLQCYECLSLHCDSGAVCDAIKSTMLEIFFPKRHFIHFDPSDICPENELPMNSLRWMNLSKPCERSDSICLVSPIEVHTVVDGKKDGKQLDKEYTLITHGYLLGCASRRKLLEFPETINVRVEFTNRNESGNGSGGKRTSTGSNSQNSNGGNQRSSEGASGGLKEKGNDSSKKQTEIFYNLTNARNGSAEFDPTKKKYKDGYTITKIYSHVFYIDQGTKNATRCYEDNCNDKIKFRRGGSSSSGIKMMSCSNSTGMIAIIFAIFFIIST